MERTVKIFNTVISNKNTFTLSEYVNLMELCYGWGKKEGGKNKG